MVSFDKELLNIILLSLRVTGLALFLASILGIPLGVFLAIKKFKGKAILMNFVNAFMSLPPVVAGLIVYILLSNKTGLVGNNKVLFTPLAMIIAQIFLAIPLLIGLSYNAISQVNKMIYITARSLGAKPVWCAIEVIKEAKFGIFSAFIVVFGRLIAEVGAVMMVGGNIRFETRVMTTAIALNKGMGEFQTAMALGIILLIMSFFINGVLEILKNFGRT